MSNLLSAIEVISGFPNEKLRMKAPKTVPIIASIRFDSMFKRHYSADQINSTTSYLSSVPYPTYGMNPDNHILTFPYPKAFPLEWYVGRDNDQFFEAEIIDARGVTGCTVFPTHFFPKLSSVYTDYSIILSTVLASAQYFNESSVNMDWNGYDIAYDLFLDSNAKLFGPLPVSTYTQIPCAYFGGSRMEEAFATITHEVSTLSADFLNNILPHTFELVIPITNISASKSPIGYTGDSDYNIFDPGRNGLLKGRARSDLNVNPISSNINYSTGVFGLTYNHSYFASAGDCLASYRTSATPTPTLGARNASTGAILPLLGSITTDFFQLTSTIPIYYYNIPFTFNHSTTLSANKYPTMFWNLDATTVNNGTSSVTVSARMRDNFRQGWWDLRNSGASALLSYQTEVPESNLSCFVGGNYVAPTQQVPASSVFTFRNDGLFQNYTVTMVLSTFTDSIQKSSDDFTLNSDRANFEIKLTPYANTLIAELISDAVMDEDQPIRWDFDDNQYIEMFTMSATRIPINTNCYLTTATRISARKLGVDATRVICYNEEYNISASKTWYPVSASYTNVTAFLTGSFNNSAEHPNGNIEAKLMKAGNTYNLPETSYIGWSMVPTSTISVLLTGATSPVFLNGNYYHSPEGKRLTYNAYPTCAEVSPTHISMPFRANIYSDLFNINSSPLDVEVIEKPCDASITFQILSGGLKYDSADDCDVAVLSTGTHNFVLSADLSTIIAPASSIYWFTNGVTLSSGSLTAAITLTNLTTGLSCFSVLATGVSAKAGAFPLNDYSDSFCFCFDTSLNNLDFTVYPENQWNGTAFGALTSSTLSRGPSAYGNCHEECFVISATPGFSTYIFGIGADVYEQTSNVLNVCYSAETSSTSAIRISAFDSCYSRKCPVTTLNSVSSVVGDRQRDFITFRPFENPVNNSLINDTVFNLNDPFLENDIILSSIFVYTNSPVNVVSGSLTLTLTDDEGNEKSKVVDLNGSVNILSDTWTTELSSSLFYIRENSVGIYDLEMSGTLFQNISGQDFCGRTITMPTKSFAITAVSGPEIAIYTEKQCLSTNEWFNYSNDSVLVDNSFGLSTLRINFGDNVISSVSADYRTGSHRYSANGTYTWTVTGKLNNGLLNVVTFDDFISVSSPQITLDRDVQRGFPSDIILPHTCADLADFSNDWTNSNTFNQRVSGVFENFEYIKEQSFIYDPVLPQKYLGWLGNRNSNTLKWNATTHLNETQRTFENITDVVQDSGYIFLVDSNRLKIYDNNFYPRLLVDKATIGDDDEWVELKTIQKNGTVVSVLDRGNHALYFYKWNGNFSTKLLYYFGGWGNENSRYKFNAPRDFYFGNKTVIVCDTDNYCVKQYNETYSWIATRSYAERPISVTRNSTGIYILLEDKQIIKYDLNFEYVSSWYYTGILTDTTKMRSNNDFIFINGSSVYKFTLNGSLVGIFAGNVDDNITGIGFSDGNLYLSEPTIIHKVCDGTHYLDIRNVASDPSLYDISAVQIEPLEFVTTEIYNDSLFKIYHNFNTLFDSFTARFFEIVSPCDDTFESFVVSAFDSQSPLVSGRIGKNECIAYETIGREFNNICYNFDQLVGVLESERIYPAFPDDCLTWENMMMSEGGRCAVGGNRRPISWYELTHGMECTENAPCWTTISSYFSAITAYPNWLQIPYSVSACNYVTTNFTTVTCNSSTGLIYFSYDQ